MNTCPIINTSVDDAKNHLSFLRTADDPAAALATIEVSITAEQARSTPRGSLITLMARTAKHLRARIAEEATIVAAGDALAADWEAAREALAATLRHGRMWIVGQIMVGAHLARIKETLGFQHGGGRPVSNSASVAELSWRDHVSANLRVEGRAVAARTADHLIRVYEAAKVRLKRLGHDRAAGLLALSSTALTDSDREDLHKLVASVTDGATQRELLEEFRLVSVPVPPPPPDNLGETPGDPEAVHRQAAEQMAFAFFYEPTRALLKVRTSHELETHLLSLPLLSCDDPDGTSLTILEQDLAYLLEKVKDAKAAKIEHLTNRR